MYLEYIIFSYIRELKQWWQQSTNHTVVGVLGWLIEL